MNMHSPTPTTRREFLSKQAMGLGTVALASLLQQENLLATPPSIPRGQQRFDLAPKQPHFAPKAKSMISLFMHGGPAHMDLTDPKPELSRMDGKSYQGDIQYSFIKRASKRLFGFTLEIQEAWQMRHGDFRTAAEHRGHR